MNVQGKTKKILIISLKVIGWICLSIVGLLVIVALAIQIPVIQNKLVQTAVNFLQEKIQTKVSLDHISLSIPKSIVLTGLYLEDQKQDTLLYAGELSVNTDLWALTENKIQLNDVSLDNFKAAISRNEQDSAFNFDYILDAFATDTTVAPDTTQTPWSFALGNINLSNIQVAFNDSLMGNDLEMGLRTLELSIEEFDLDKSRIKVDELSIDDLNASFVQSKSVTDTVDVVPDSSSQSVTFDLGINEVALAKVNLSYSNTVMGQQAVVKLGEMNVEANAMDLKTRKIDLSLLRLHNTFLSYHQSEGSFLVDKKTEAAEQPADSTNTSWTINLDELSLAGNSIQYHDFNKPVTKNAFDANHVWVTNLETEANDLVWEGSNMSGALEELSFRERSGLVVESFSAQLTLSDTAAVVKNFRFKSAHTAIALEGEATFPSLAQITERYDLTAVDLKIEPSVISYRDVHLFAPDLLDSVPLTIPLKTTVAFEADVSGLLSKLLIDRLVVKTFDSTHLDIAGTVGLQKQGDHEFDLRLKRIFTTRTDITSAVVDTLLPASIALPDWLLLTGGVRGTANSPTAEVHLASNFGDVLVNAALSKNAVTEITSYKGNLRVEKFQTGKLLKQEQIMGPLSLTASIDGSGFTMGELDTKLKLNVSSFTYQNYEYRDFNIDGYLNRYFFEGVASLNDKNLTMKLDGALDFNEEVPNYRFKFELKNADLQALNLSERPLKARGTLEVDLATADFKIINGDLGIRKFAVANGEDVYAVDSLLFASVDQKGQSEVSIRSDIIDGDFQGTINFYSLGEVIQRHFNNYFSLHDSVFDKPAAPQNFKFSLTIKDTDLITEILVPELEPFVPGVITGEFDSNNDDLQMRIGLAQIRYGTMGTDSITFNMDSDSEKLTYKLALRKIKMDTLGIESLMVQGTVADDSIRTKLVILDSVQRDKYVIGGVFYSLEEMFQFKLLPDEVLMNYAPWSTPADNNLKFTAAGIQAHNFSITNINESISVLTTNDEDSTVSVSFKDLNLQNITRLVEGRAPVDGLANGDLNIMVADKGAFNSRLTIDRLQLFDHEWGDLAVALGRTKDGPLNIDVRIESETTELKAYGYLSRAATPEINFVADILKFDLSNVGVLTGGQLKNTSGNLTANVTVTGNTTTPEIEGKVHFDEAKFTPAMVNSEFALNDETITLQGERIILSDFEIRDRENNLAKITGDIVSEGFQTFVLNLKLAANDFQVLNSTAKDNDLFYGKVGLTTTANITGTATQPVINMRINLTEDSDFTYVIPQSEKGVLEQEGIVEWVDRDAKKDPFLASIEQRDTVKSTFTGIDLSANIELNDQETFNIIIDPATGDKLSVKGNSTLTLDIDPTGDMVLTGRYEISEGTYDLSFYKMVKRNFSIEKGSTITWAGNPLDATMDIRAIYEVETSPIDLIASQSTDQQELNTYKQRLPFLVYLEIKGDLMTPEIGFQLDMAEANRNAFGGVVYAKIRDINTRESDLNKQVFALLILKRFISDNPLDSKAGSDVASTARRSVSKLLSEQLNRLSENVEGVELTFDVKSYEDYSSGSGEGQTDVQLGLSKSLLDDRLVVKVSGNFEVEGERSQNSASDYIGDLALEYKLTEDGRFRITGFRNTQFDMINGELLETGVGLIYIKDYNTLRELFRANEKDK